MVCPLRPDHRHAARRPQGGAAPSARFRRGRAAAGQPQEGPADFVSMADKRAEQTIVEELRNARPDWGMLLRGRRARSRAIPTSRAGSSIRSTAPPTSSTASRISPSRSRSRSKSPAGKAEITHGLVYQPLTDESFWAEKGRGAWLNDAPPARLGPPRPRRSADRDRYSAFGRGDLASWSTHLRRDRARGVAASAASARPRSISPGSRRAVSTASGKRISTSGTVAAGLLLVREAGGFVTRFPRPGPDARAPRISCRKRRSAQQAPQAAGGIARGDPRGRRGGWRLPPQPATAVTVDPSHRLIEGVASDGSTIWAVEPDRPADPRNAAELCTAIATLPGGLHPFAIAWDAKRRNGCG